MARTVRHAPLETPTARARLKRGRQAHWRALGAGSHLGYRRRPRDREGRWLVRRLIDVIPNIAPRSVRAAPAIVHICDFKKRCSCMKSDLVSRFWWGVGAPFSVIVLTPIKCTRIRTHPCFTYHSEGRAAQHHRQQPSRQARCV